jgi:DNA modification methylase
MLTTTEPAVDLRAGFDRLREIDWDFPESWSQSSFSKLHWHPCRYPSQVPAAVIGTLSSVGEVVLDPFLGSGTTAVEAQRLNRGCIGIEINPVAALISRAKTLNCSADRVQKLINDIRLEVRQNGRRSSVLRSVQSAKWYTERTLNDLRRIWYIIDSLRGDKKLIAQTAFSAILLPVCRETRHWGYVCDNTAPKGDYERNVLEVFDRTLTAFADAYLERDGYWASEGRRAAAAKGIDVREGDARTILKEYSPESAQLIMTSPPYFGVADYAKAQRLTFEWFGLDIESIRQSEIGARSKRRRVTAAEEYLAECREVFSECRRILQMGRACVVIFGESTERAPIHSSFIETVKTCGFKLEFSVPRAISQRRRLSPRLHMEHLLLFT